MFGFKILALSLFGFSQIVSEGERVKIKNPTEIYLCVNCEVKKLPFFRERKRHR